MSMLTVRDLLGRLRSRRPAWWQAILAISPELAWETWWQIRLLDEERAALGAVARAVAGCKGVENHPLPREGNRRASA